VPKVAVYDMDDRQVGEMDLNDEVFGAEVNQALLHQAVVMYEANKRQGTANTKTRGLVRGGGRKPWRQKGTGRARQGSIRSPQWRGGGTVFGPHPREWRQAMPRKARQAALRSALSAKTASGEIVVLDKLQMLEPKTKVMAEFLDTFRSTRAIVRSPPTQLVGGYPARLTGFSFDPLVDVSNPLAEIRLRRTHKANLSSHGPNGFFVDPADTNPGWRRHIYLHASSRNNLNWV
jgi:large subunit ribosomal protein L4